MLMSNTAVLTSEEGINKEDSHYKLVFGVQGKLFHRFLRNNLIVAMPRGIDRVELIV